MNDKITFYKVQGHNGWRVQKQLHAIRFVKDFYGSEDKRHREAAAWWEDIKTRYSNNWDGTKTWDFFKTKWEEWAKSSSKAKEPMAERTIYEYKWAFSQAQRLIAPLRYLADITIENLRRARGTLAEEAATRGNDNYGPNKFVTCMRSSLAWAMEQGYMRDILINNFHTLPTADIKVKTQSVKEIELLLKYGSTKERIVVLLGFDCGCRPEEMANMLVEKLDLENLFGDISDNAEDARRGIHYWHPKCHKVRQIRLTERLKKEILLLNPKGPYLITNQYGEPYSQEGFSHFYRKFVKRVNEEIRQKEKKPIKITGTCKTLRKDYSTSRQGQGATIEETGKSMGHAGKEVTLEHYTNTATPQMRQQERERLKKLDKFIVPLKY